MMDDIQMVRDAAYWAGKEVGRADMLDHAAEIVRSMGDDRLADDLNDRACQARRLAEQEQQRADRWTNTCRESFETLQSRLSHMTVSERVERCARQSRHKLHQPTEYALKDAAE
jgi:DNA anti-recombination protein RmuC